MAIWGPIIGAAVGLYGANKSANAAKQAQSERNEAVDQQYEYDVQAWQMQKEAAIADREYAVQEIQERARQEGMLAAYKDAQQAESYNYNLQIRNLQQETNEKMYRKSEDIYFNINRMKNINVKVGQKVKQGQIVGTLGKSGRATGPHLDIRLNWFDVKLDPATILN